MACMVGRRRAARSPIPDLSAVTVMPSSPSPSATLSPSAVPTRSVTLPWGTGTMCLPAAPRHAVPRRSTSADESAVAWFSTDDRWPAPRSPIADDSPARSPRPAARAPDVPSEPAAVPLRAPGPPDNGAHPPPVDLPSTASSAGHHRRDLQPAGAAQAVAAPLATVPGIGSPATPGADATLLGAASFVSDATPPGLRRAATGSQRGPRPETADHTPLSALAGNADRAGLSRPLAWSSSVRPDAPPRSGRSAVECGHPATIPAGSDRAAPPTSTVPLFAAIRSAGGSRRRLRELFRDRRRVLAVALAVAAVVGAALASGALGGASHTEGGRPAHTGGERGPSPGDRSRSSAGHDSPGPVSTPASHPPDPGTVRAPVRLADAEVVRLLRPGDRVDLVAATDPSLGGPSGSPVVARGAEVTRLPAPPKAGGDHGALVVLAMPRKTATAVVAAAATSALAVVMR